MASALSHLSPMSGREREGWSDGGGEDQVEDEFACSGALRGALLSFHPSLERIFGVSFMIGREEDAVLPHDGQIWLKLTGGRNDVVAAKLFVKGVVNQEAPQEVPYPGVLHCVFCGARGLFMDCLIRNTSARIVVVSPGFLLISGLAEPVVRAYSLITDLVERSKGTQGQLSEPSDRTAGETLDSRRAFKSLVERWDDRHTLDLLVLPGAVKETLLDLVRESGLGSNTGPGGLNPGHGGSNPGHGYLNPGPELGLNLGLGGSRDGVGLMDTDTQRLWDSQYELEALTLMDTRIGTRAGEARDIQEVQGISMTKSTTKPSEHSYHNQDPGLRNIEQFSHQTFTTAPVKGREGSRYGTHGGIGIGNEAAPRDPIFHSFPQKEDIRGRAEGSEGAKEVQGHSPQEVKEEGHLEEEEEMETEEGEGNMMSVGSKEEFGLLLKFFTAMGYAEDVVLRVLAQTRPREASQILDLVQQEQNRTRLAMNGLVELAHREVEERGREGEECGGEEVRGKRSGIDKRVEMEGGVGEGVRAREEQREEKGRGGESAGLSEEVDRGRGEGGRESDEGNSKGGEVGNEEDFVLGVLKRAAANCGYTEEKVTEVYSTLPELSIRQLLLELQREGTRETEAKSQDRVRDEPREVNEVDSEVRKKKCRKEETEKERGEERKAPAQTFTTTENRGVERKNAKGERKTDEVGGVKVPNQTVDGPVRVEPDLAQWNAVMNQVPFPTHGLQKNPTQTRQLPAQTHTPRRASPPLVRGPPQPTYPIILPPQPTNLPLFPHQLVYPLTQPHQTTLDSALTVNNSSATRVKEKWGFLTLATEVPERKGLPAPAVERWGLPPMAAGSLVTGQQRFLEGLQTPFDLKLTDQPGDPGLRMVVIDGSNVAMSHGLGHFFSCRGIALAVQHFWNRGHRRVSTFLPQWRQKRDSRIKEQHYLTDLQNLGLLSYTPSREIEGKRINSYDDRFMLQLAQETDGVIVTNDNLRDLLDESHKWRDIIKKRLLQYTFVGDHFMVPDDPLGREGPHLDDFLRSLHRTPVPGSHSFAGIASTPFPQAPRAQTEVLKSSQARGRGKRKGQAKAGHGSPGMDLVPGMGLGLDMERSAAETSRLRESLSQVFPGQDSIVTLVLQCNPTVTDINSLSDFMLQQ
ncbi:NEDD4-binding protein 1 [Salvelinus sp. IW2-2015]|uniref:NEDD4-binding protein 1 n=1 Tax=Salvelinus sp. IW2-2015 TaxID=2691554 RepID=UPI000CDFE7E1|nr:NEDD4-binding protein 1 [Salvelinus alpinus]